MTAPHLRPLGLGEILDVAIKIVWRNAGTLTRAVVVVVLPVQVLTTIILVSAAPQGTHLGVLGTESSDTPLSGSDAAAFAAGVGAAGLLGVVAGLLAAGACYRAIASAYLEQQTGWRESLRYAAARFPGILWVTILTGLLVVVGLVFCLVPGIYLFVCFAVSVPVLMTEGLRGRKALGRSRRLVAGSWWRAFGVIVLGGILTGIVELVVSGLLVAVTSIGSGSSTLVQAVASIVTGTLSKAITTPFTAAFTTILYFDLRVRREGFDLQLLADRLGVEPPVGYAPPAEPAPTGAPPYWPPPPGWQPPPAPPADEGASSPSSRPPFWPPPPGWKPGEGV